MTATHVVMSRYLLAPVGTRDPLELPAVPSEATEKHLRLILTEFGDPMNRGHATKLRSEEASAGPHGGIVINSPLSPRNCSATSLFVDMLMWHFRKTPSFPQGSTNLESTYASASPVYKGTSEAQECHERIPIAIESVKSKTHHVS